MMVLLFDRSPGKVTLRYIEQKWNGYANPSVAYEVVRIRRREAREIKGEIIVAAEVYPRSEAWGVDGFTFTDKGTALAKLRQMKFKR